MGAVIQVRNVAHCLPSLPYFFFAKEKVTKRKAIFGPIAPRAKK